MQWDERIGRRLKLRDLHILMSVAQCGTMGKAASREYVYFDPIYTLGDEGQQWWRDQVANGLPDAHWVEPPAPVEPAATALSSTTDSEPAPV
jgi:hypothetical protein